MAELTPPNKSKDSPGCIAMLMLGAFVLGFITLTSSGRIHPLAWLMAGGAVVVLIVQRSIKASQTSPDGVAGHRMPMGWTWENTSTTVTELWSHQRDMFDATHYRDVAKGRSHGHDVALVTPAGGRSTGHYLVVRLHHPVPEFDFTLGDRLTKLPSPLDKQFFHSVEYLSQKGRHLGVRNGCFWLEISPYSTTNPASIADPVAQLVNRYDARPDAAPAALATGGRPAVQPPAQTPRTTAAPAQQASTSTRAPKQGQAPAAASRPSSPAKGRQSPPLRDPAARPAVGGQLAQDASVPPAAGASESAPVALPEWSVPSMELPSLSSLTSSPLDLPAPSSSITSSPALGEIAPLEVPTFETPAAWTVQEWQPSTKWKPDTSWSAPTYQPTTWSVTGATSESDPTSEPSPQRDREAD